jgi:hypothetical protein
VQVRDGGSKPPKEPQQGEEVLSVPVHICPNTSRAKARDSALLTQRGEGNAGGQLRYYNLHRSAAPLHSRRKREHLQRIARMPEQKPDVEDINLLAHHRLTPDRRR